MCLAIPARIVAIDGVEATVDIGGVTRKTSLMLTPEANVGDYVLMHTGFAINVIDEEEAQETMRLLEEMAALEEAAEAS
jgi:hydrogenase expression/formation protein HypC